MAARMYPSAAPTEDELLAARAVLHRDRLVRLQKRRAERRRAAPIPQSERKYQTEPVLCGYCGTAFVARVLKRAVIGRWCSASCRQLAYQRRRRLRDRRAAILADYAAAQ